MFNPDARGHVLVGLEQLRDLAAHLAYLHLLAIPQQLDPRHRHPQRRLALVGLEALVQDAGELPLALVHLRLPRARHETCVSRLDSNPTKSV